MLTLADGVGLLRLASHGGITDIAEFRQKLAKPSSDSVPMVLASRCRIHEIAVTSFTTSLALALFACDPEPSNPVVAQVAGEDITAANLKAFADLRASPVDARLLDVLIERKLIVLEANLRDLQSVPEIARGIDDIENNHIVRSYMLRKVHQVVSLSDEPGRDKAALARSAGKISARTQALTDSLWDDHRGEVYPDSIRILTALAARGDKVTLSVATRDIPLGIYDEGVITIGEFLEAVRYKSDAGDIRQQLSDRSWVVPALRTLLVSDIVRWEAHALGLHEDAELMARVEIERQDLLVRHARRAIAADHANAGEARRAYAEYLKGLRQKYNVQVFGENIPTDGAKG